MGLDLISYKQIKKIDAVFDKEGEPIDPQTRLAIPNCFQLFLSPEFPERAKEIEDGAVYEAIDAQFIRVGSYPYYGTFKDEIAKLAGYPLGSYKLIQHGEDIPSYYISAFNKKDGPFWELLNFDDCEGTLGTEVCIKLAKDFEYFMGKSMDINIDDLKYQPLKNYFKQTYNDFYKAFKFASDGGCVVFC